MAHPVKLVLSLDPPPSTVVMGNEKRKSRPRGSYGRRTIPGTQKRKRSPVRPIQLHQSIEDGYSAGEDQLIDANEPSVQHVVKAEQKPRKRVKSEKPFKPKYTQIVSIDLGMSGAGMSLASAKTDPTSIVAEMRWPGPSLRSEKVPSKVAMIVDNPDNDDFIDGEVSSFFGFEVPKGSICRSYFKTSLDHDARPSNFDDPILKTALASKLVHADTPERNREAMVVALEHLREIHIEKAQARLGDSFGDTNFKYVFTYPAACSARGIQALREAVHEAGFSDDNENRPDFLSEAHAAAMASFTSCRSQQGSEAWKRYFKRGTLVTVIDFGALTVDLTTVRIESNDPKLMLSEATIPSGGKCGTAAIHCHMMQKLAKKFGEAFTDIDKENLECGSQFFEVCEEHLKLFDESRRNRKFRINLELAESVNHRDYKSDTGEVIIHGSELKAAIDANLEYAKSLLRDQWGQPKRYGDNGFHQEDVSTTLLCGGGSLIPYVHANLRDFCAQEGMQFVHAKDPESTVCRGAVISQLRQDLYGNRLSRASFGIEVSQKGRQYVKWFLNKGDDLDTSTETVLKTVAGHIYVTYEQILDVTQSFELPVLMYNGNDVNPNSADDRDVERVSAIEIASDELSGYMRRKLRREMEAHSAQNTLLAVAVSIKVDRSARLFFEARHNTAFFGKSELRLDDTMQRD